MLVRSPPDPMLKRPLDVPRRTSPLSSYSPPMTPTRRSLLRATVGGTVLAAGCLGRGDVPGTDTPPTDSLTPIETPPECEDLRRHPIDFASDRLHESYGGFTIEAERSGGEVTVRLRNETDEERHTRNRRKYAIQHLDDEWRHVLWTSEGGWDDEAVAHAPGEGYTWTFSLDRESRSRDRYTVCTAVRPGRYRFVYFGVIDAGDEGDHALVAEFEKPE
jgi:hypothetical protein